jgi:hypothetical protein
MILRDKRTILGVQPTKRGLAFAVFDGGELLDWGRRNRSARLDDVALLDRLIGHYGVDALVVEDPDASGCRLGPRIRHLLRQLREHAETRRMRVIVVPHHALGKGWKRNAGGTKQSIAAAIAEALPVLRTVVPRPRKSFMAEDERVRIFGALILVLAATKSFPPPLAS